MNQVDIQALGTLYSILCLLSKDRVVKTDYVSHFSHGFFCGCKCWNGVIFFIVFQTLRYSRNESKALLFQSPNVISRSGG